MGRNREGTCRGVSQERRCDMCGGFSPLYYLIFCLFLVIVLFMSGRLHRGVCKYYTLVLPSLNRNTNIRWLPFNSKWRGDSQERSIFYKLSFSPLWNRNLILCISWCFIFVHFVVLHLWFAVLCIFPFWAFLTFWLNGAPW